LRVWAAAASGQGAAGEARGGRGVVGCRRVRRTTGGGGAGPVAGVHAAG